MLVAGICKSTLPRGPAEVWTTALLHNG